MPYFRRGTRQTFDCLTQTSSPLICLAYSVGAWHHQTISYQFLASASIRHCTTMSMHFLLSANGLGLSWAELLRYPSTIPMSSIPSSAHSVFLDQPLLFSTHLSATSTSASKSASVCNHQSCTYFFFVYMHPAFATHRRDASSALLHDGIFLLFQYNFLIIHVTCIHRLPSLYAFWSYRHRCPNGTALCFYFPLRPRFCRLMNWIRSGLVDRIGIRTWIWIWILVLATAFFMVLVLPGLQ
jgi:hypothetical protein